MFIVVKEMLQMGLANRCLQPTQPPLRKIIYHPFSGVLSLAGRNFSIFCYAWKVFPETRNLAYRPGTFSTLIYFSGTTLQLIWGQVWDWFGKHP